MARLPSQGTKSSTGRTILCVDDQEEFLDATRLVLCLLYTSPSPPD